jgi:ABC-type transport system substrate-binding protein
VDPDKRKALYYTALTIIVEETPWLFLYNPSEVFAQSDRVQGWTPRSDALFNLDTVWVTD